MASSNTHPQNPPHSHKENGLSHKKREKPLPPVEKSSVAYFVLRVLQKYTSEKVGFNRRELVEKIREEYGDWVLKDEKSIDKALAFIEYCKKTYGEDWEYGYLESSSQKIYMKGRQFSEAQCFVLCKLVRNCEEFSSDEKARLIDVILKGQNLETRKRIQFKEKMKDGRASSDYEKLKNLEKSKSSDKAVRLWLKGKKLEVPAIATDIYWGEGSWKIEYVCLDNNDKPFENAAMINDIERIDFSEYKFDDSQAKLRNYLQRIRRASMAKQRPAAYDDFQTSALGFLTAEKPAEKVVPYLKENGYVFLSYSLEALGKKEFAYAIGDIRAALAKLNPRLPLHDEKDFLNALPLIVENKALLRKQPYPGACLVALSYLLLNRAYAGVDELKNLMWAGFYLQPTLEENPDSEANPANGRGIFYSFLKWSYFHEPDYSFPYIAYYMHGENVIAPSEWREWAELGLTRSDRGIMEDMVLCAISSPPLLNQDGNEGVFKKMVSLVGGDGFYTTLIPNIARALAKVDPSLTQERINDIALNCEQQDLDSWVNRFVDEIIH